MKIISIIGARPQFIKAAMVSRVLRRQCEEILIHTGQHYDINMSDIFFQELGLPDPEINLRVGSGTHAEQTGQMMIGIEKVLESESPSYVLVYGDTNTTLAGALAAAKLQIPVAHVEAGLRSFNRAMPEEINRVLTDHIAEALFCPAGGAAANLNLEGIHKGVYVVGDVMYDALVNYLGLSHQKSQALKKFKLEPKGYALVTLHRAANTDDACHLRSILQVLGQLGLPVVFPVHPRTRKVIQSLGISLAENIRAVEPIGYLDMLQLEESADCILTDSGGMQKEAYWLGVRCITLRDETEWVETITEGWNILAGMDHAKIIDGVKHWRPGKERQPIYGDGHAAEKIANILISREPALRERN